MARGTKVTLAYAEQTAVETVPTTGWKTLPRVSDSLNNAVELTDSETINDSRIKTAGMVTSATAEGDVEAEFIKGTYDDLIAAAAGNEWQEGEPAVGQSTVTFGGDVVKIFAIEKANKDIGQYHLWRGMQVNSFTLDIPESGYIGLTFGFMGRGYDNQTTTAYSKTPAASATAPKATSLTVGDIKVNDSTLKGVACVTAFSFELTNNIEKQNCLGSGLYGSNLLAMLADMTGSITMAYSKKSQELLNTQLTGGTIKIEATINFGDDTYTLTIPKAQVSGDVPSGGRDLLDAQLSYTVVAETMADAPTFTKTTA